jgi:hypothetical protein
MIREHISGKKMKTEGDSDESWEQVMSLRPVAAGAELPGTATRNRGLKVYVGNEGNELDSSYEIVPKIQDMPSLRSCVFQRHSTP